MRGTPVVPPGPVSLRPVTPAVLDTLVAVAVAHTHPAEVTPGPAVEDGRWTSERIGWLRAFHEQRRRGLDGPAREATWAVLSGGRVVGAARLARTERAGAVECGAWLARAARGRGLGTATLAALVAAAAGSGVSVVCARTTSGNAAACAALRSLGFTWTEAAGPVADRPGRSGGTAILAELQLAATGAAGAPGRDRRPEATPPGR